MDLSKNLAGRCVMRDASEKPEREREREYVCMCTCICIDTHIYIYIYAYIYIYICMYVCIYIYTYIHIYIYIFVFICLHDSIYVYLSTCLPACAHARACIVVLWALCGARWGHSARRAGRFAANLVTCSYVHVVFSVYLTPGTNMLWCGQGASENI